MLLMLGDPEIDAINIPYNVGEKAGKPHPKTTGPVEGAKFPFKPNKKKVAECCPDDAEPNCKNVVEFKFVIVVEL